MIPRSATCEAKEQPEDDHEHADQHRNVPKEVGVGVQVHGYVHASVIGTRKQALERAGRAVSSHVSFSGSVPANYDRYLGPALFEPYAVDLAGRIPAADGLSVLELACGTGRVTARLRAALPEAATLVATDLNEPMLEYARSATPDRGITWRQADAQALPFGDGSFDVVVCQFGLMFLPDKVQGLREARRVLVPGGVLIASVWESVAAHPHAVGIDAVLRKLFPESPPTFLDAPHGYFEPGRIRADFAAAGWAEPRIETVRFLGEAPSSRDIATGFVTGSPLAHELAERGADPDEVVDRITAALGDEAPYRFDIVALVLTATA
jgi:SAM-dependent methyltransferase